MSKARHCQIAELSAILADGARISLSDWQIDVSSDHKALILKTESLLTGLFHIRPTVSRRIGLGGLRVRGYQLKVQGETNVRKILRECGFLEDKRSTKENQRSPKENQRSPKENASHQPGLYMPDRMLQRSCCRRAYLRGAFLACGSINDPTKNYHIEFLCDQAREASRLKEMLSSFDVDPGMLERTRRGTRRVTNVLYLKDSEYIVDVLRIIKAPLSLMELENVRVEKDVKNHIQRRVNCEAANISKIVGASVRQIDAIRFLTEQGVFDTLPEELIEIAGLRMEYPDMGLKELGALVDPPISKSGVNHRLKKIIQFSEELKERKEQNAGNTSDRGERQ
ncbi:MAG: DNA-binding protein WhiA [Firmicutes bacterium]|nr:DNA-binding protein WhiA [Bacillota bacterium]